MTPCGEIIYRCAALSQESPSRIIPRRPTRRWRRDGFWHPRPCCDKPLRSMYGQLLCGFRLRLETVLWCKEECTTITQHSSMDPLLRPCNTKIWVFAGKFINNPKSLTPELCCCIQFLTFTSIQQTTASFQRLLVSTCWFCLWNLRPHPPPVWCCCRT